MHPDTKTFVFPDGIELVDGDFWPVDDKECRPAVMRTFKDADKGIELCQGKQVVIQAGGNCGIWARYLSKHFETVYTFEPDITNFLCLNLNAPQPNIVRMQAALGMKNKPISMLNTPKNIGAHRVAGSGGTIPVIRIDDLRLPALDLLQLDIEGYEYFALQGAVHSIDKYHPVIMIEDKGHHQKYGVRRDAMDELFESLGYKAHSKINRDLILIHRDHPAA